MNNHKFDGGYSKQKQTQKFQHIKKDQDIQENEEVLSLEGKCYCCGKSGHKSPQCRCKNKPKDKWFINKVQFTQKSTENTNKTSANTKENTEYNGNTTISSTTNSKQSGWTNLNYNLSNYNTDQQNKMHQMVLLDSDSTNTIFCNKEYVNNIRTAPKPPQIQTNGGIMKVNHICDSPYLGTQWFSKDAITNIISLADITQNYRVTMDTAKEKSMMVHLDHKKVKFSQM